MRMRQHRVGRFFSQLQAFRVSACIMGQYWEWLCLDKKEKLGTHELSYGLKWLEQLSASGMYSGIMLLKTDVSSLGHGGGDLQLQDVPSPLQPLVAAVIGRWTRCRVEFAGDYGEIHEKYKTQFGWVDISANVAAAIFSVHHEGWYDAELSANANIEILKNELVKHPDFEYSSVDEFKDKEFIRLIKMALTAGSSVSAKQSASTTDKTDKVFRAASSDPSSGKSPSGKSSKHASGNQDETVDKDKSTENEKQKVKRPRGAAPKDDDGKPCLWDDQNGCWYSCKTADEDKKRDAKRPRGAAPKDDCKERCLWDDQNARWYSNNPNSGYWWWDTSKRTWVGP